MNFVLPNSSLESRLRRRHTVRESFPIYRCTPRQFFRPHSLNPLCWSPLWHHAKMWVTCGWLAILYFIREIRWPRASVGQNQSMYQGNLTMEKDKLLKSSDEKTEVLLLGIRSSLNTLLRITAIIGDSQLKVISMLESLGSFLTRNYQRTAQSESEDLLCTILGAFPAFANFLIFTLLNPLYRFWLHHASTMWIVL